MSFCFPSTARLDVTFLDVTVFHRCSVGMSSIMSNLRPCFQFFPGWNQRYAWGRRWSASLPVARILPKPSKAFMKARPIIACDHCWHSRLTTFLAKGVFQIMLVVFPPGSTFNMLSVQQVIRTMWHSMMSFPATEPVNMIQQDLIGLFNSVPHDRILQALTYTLFPLQEKWEKAVAGTIITTFIPQQGLSFPGFSRTSPICSQEH